jgi:serralysin
VWNTDSDGNYVSSIVTTVSGSSSALESLEPSFHQDLNGDGVIGVPTTVIETAGSTSLVQSGNNFFLDSISSGTGPELKYGGANVVVGQLGSGWTPIGTEQTSGGYEVAWRIPDTGTFTIWSTDSNGNYISSTGMTATSVETVESSFHQDLNGDGLLGTPHPVIALAGPTKVGGDFYLNSNSAASGLESNHAGANYSVGQAGERTHVGAEQTQRGYAVAWKFTGADRFGDWNSDSNGNHVSNIGGVSRISSTIESAETSFHRDVNGDGVIGTPVDPRASVAANAEARESALIAALGNDDRFVFRTWQQANFDSHVVPLITSHNSLDMNSRHAQITNDGDPILIIANHDSLGLAEFHTMLKINDFIIH